MAFSLLLNPFVGLLPVLLALWYLRRHRNDAPGEGAAWLRKLSIALLVLFVAGFGLCGTWGTAVGLISMVTGSGESRAYSPIFLIAGALGLGIAAVLAWAFRRLTRPDLSAASSPAESNAP